MTTVEEIKHRLDILEVIGDSTALQKMGRNYRGLCPFHQEKNPSFYVFPERGSWYCFGRCNEGGDVFSFIMKRENLSFGEALRRLAERAGVALAPPPQNEAQRQEKEDLYQINEAAARFYHRLLLSPAGQEVREYLRGRGVAVETIPAFTLGYAPPGWHHLGPHLRQLGYSPEQGKRAGLLIGEGDHDLFHHRLLFPIREGGGQVAGFGGRALDSSLPKYLNSPATPVFDKKSLLYGLDRAKEAIRKQDRAVIVEGYMDVLIAHQAGYAETVATMGVALTENQLLTLKRLTRHLVLSLDADEAGVEAVLRGAETADLSLSDRVGPILTYQGKGKVLVSYERLLDAEIRVVALPQGKDPDELILEDTKGWEERVGVAAPVMDFLLEALPQGIELKRWEEKRELVNKLKPLFDEIKDPIRWGHYFQQLSRRLRVGEVSLKAALSTRGRARGEPPPEPAPTPSPLSLQERLLGLLLHYPQLRPMGEQIEAGLWEDPLCRELFQLWQQDPQGQGWAGEPALAELAQRLRETPPQPIPPPHREAALSALMLRLREQKLRLQLSARQEVLAETPSLEPLETEIKTLNTELLKVGRQLHTLTRTKRE